MQRTCGPVFDQAACVSASSGKEQQQQQQLLSGTAMPPALMDKAVEILHSEDAATTPRHYTQQELVEASASGSKGAIHHFSPPASWHKLASQLLSSSDDEDITSTDAERKTDQQQGLSTANRPADSALLPCRLEQRFLQEISAGLPQQQQHPRQSRQQQLAGMSTSPPRRAARAAAVPAQHGLALPGTALTAGTPALQQRLAALARDLRLSEDLGQPVAQVQQQLQARSSSARQTPLGKHSRHAGPMHRAYGTNMPAQAPNASSFSSSSADSVSNMGLGPHDVPGQSRGHAQRSPGQPTALPVDNFSPARTQPSQLSGSLRNSLRSSGGIGRHRAADISSHQHVLSSPPHMLDVQQARAGRLAGSCSSSPVLHAAAAESVTRRSAQHVRAQASSASAGAHHARPCGRSPLLHAALDMAGKTSENTRPPARKQSPSTPVSAQLFPKVQQQWQRRQQDSAPSNEPQHAGGSADSNTYSGSSSRRGGFDSRHSPNQHPGAAADFQTPPAHLCAAFDQARTAAGIGSVTRQAFLSASVSSRGALEVAGRHFHSQMRMQDQQQQDSAAMDQVISSWKLSAWLMRADARTRPQRLVRRARAVNLSSDSGDAAADSDSGSSSGGSSSGSGSSGGFAGWVSASKQVCERGS